MPDWVWITLALVVAASFVLLLFSLLKMSRDADRRAMVWRQRNSELPEVEQSKHVRPFRIGD